MGDYDTAEAHIDAAKPDLNTAYSVLCGAMTRLDGLLTVSAHADLISPLLSLVEVLICHIIVIISVNS